MLDPTFIGPVFPCREWPGARWNEYGNRAHPVLSTKIVHRQTWIEVFGPPPPDRSFVLHRCDNPPCFEITHLYCGTQADNMRDREERGRSNHPNAAKTHCKRGHAFDEENTLVRPDGSRRCRACRRIDEKRRRS